MSITYIKGLWKTFNKKNTTTVMKKLPENTNLSSSQRKNNEWFLVTGEDSQPHKENEHENYTMIPFLTHQIG